MSSVSISAARPASCNARRASGVWGRSSGAMLGADKDRGVSVPEAEVGGVRFAPDEEEGGSDERDRTCHARLMGKGHGE